MNTPESCSCASHLVDESGAVYCDGQQPPGAVVLDPRVPPKDRFTLWLAGKPYHWGYGYSLLPGPSLWDTL